MVDENVQYILFCPGCGRKRPESRDEAIAQHEAGQSDCCNPECQGDWGTNCYHCHHPKFWPKPLYEVTASLKSKKKPRVIVSYMRRYDNFPSKAEQEFTTKLKQMLLVEHGSRWEIVVREKYADNPSDEGRIVAAYDHYARGATVYHDPISVKKRTVVTQQAWVDTAKTEVKKMQTEKMTQAEALEALRVYMSQQVEIEAIDILDMVIEALVSNPGEHCRPHRRVKIEIGQVPVDYAYNEALESAHRLELGKLVPPKWLERFQKLVAEIRDEFDLYRPPAETGEQQ